MSRSSFPQRVVWPKLLPGFSLWLAAAGVLLAGISLILTGNSNLDLGTKVGLCLVALVFPILAHAIWKIVSTIWQRMKQYNSLCDELERADLNNRQLQGNYVSFLQTLASAGLRVFDVTGIVWGNPSPLLVIACSQQGLVGSMLVVVKIPTLDILGQFKVVQPMMGGYLAQEGQIENAVWWGLLHDEVARHPHSRMDHTVAILLH